MSALSNDMATNHSATAVSAWRRTRTGPARLATAALLGLAVALVAVVDPHTGGRYPTCPFHAVTGLWCPGCGGLRAVHDLTHGHLALALHENVLVVLLGPSLVLWWLIARNRRTDDRPVTLLLSARGTLAIALLLAGFALVRNLPIGAGLAP
jgi:Protein of unknown function (DUF2752)